MVHAKSFPLRPVTQSRILMHHVSASAYTAYKIKSLLSSEDIKLVTHPAHGPDLWEISLFSWRGATRSIAYIPQSIQYFFPSILVFLFAFSLYNIFQMFPMWLNWAGDSNKIGLIN